MKKDKLREFYIDHHKKLNKYNYGKKTTGGQRVIILKDIIGSGKKILDLGCRDGSFTRFFMEGNEVVGVDIDDVALSLCSKNLGIKTFHCDLSDDFPFEDLSFDVVIAGEIIEHVMFPDFFVKEARRVLKPGGFFCGSTDNVYRLKSRWRFLTVRPFCDDPSHLHFFSYDSLNNILQKYFNSVEIIPHSGHIIGKGKFGISVTKNTPLPMGKLFARTLTWKAIKKI